jgi:hypothetical protein
MAEAENYEEEWPNNWDEMKNEEACCGMLVSQIGYAWTCCPYCGTGFDPAIMDFQDYFGTE